MRSGRGIVGSGLACAAWGVLFVVVLAGIVSCGERGSAAVVRHYTFRGKIVNLPGAGGDRYLRIHHEAVKDYHNKFGENVGMREMIMEFPWLSPGLTLDGFRGGESVEFELDVDYSKSESYVVTAIRPLPAGVNLKLEMP